MTSEAVPAGLLVVLAEQMTVAPAVGIAVGLEASAVALVVAPVVALVVVPEAGRPVLVLALGRGSG